MQDATAEAANTRSACKTQTTRLYHKSLSLFNTRVKPPALPFAFEQSGLRALDFERVASQCGQAVLTACNKDCCMVNPTLHACMQGLVATTRDNIVYYILSLLPHAHTITSHIVRTYIYMHECRQYLWDRFLVHIHYPCSMQLALKCMAN